MQCYKEEHRRASPGDWPPQRLKNGLKGERCVLWSWPGLKRCSTDTSKPSNPARKSQGTRSQRSPEQFPTTSSSRVSPSCTPWSVLENPHAELRGCCWAGTQHWHRGLHLPHPTACSSQALFFPQIYHDVCLYFNFNLILLLSHQQAWIIYKASFLWGFFRTVQWYFLSCCSCVTATFPARPGYFSIPSPQTAVRACWCFQYSWRSSCVYERAGRGRMGETRRRVRVEKGKKLPLQ